MLFKKFVVRTGLSFVLGNGSHVHRLSRRSAYA